MNNTHPKPRIVRFQRHPKFLAVDWQTLERSFKITIESGGAIIHSHPSPSSRFRYAIGAGIGTEQMQRFFLRQDPDTKLTEIVLGVRYEPFEESLGLTDNPGEAEEWIREANEIIQRCRRKKGLDDIPADALTTE